MTETMLRPASQAEVSATVAAGLFDAAWYEAEYPDVRAAGMAPLDHYLWLGWRLGRAAGPGGVVPVEAWPPPPLGDFWLP